MLMMNEQSDKIYFVRDVSVYMADWIKNVKVGMEDINGNLYSLEEVSQLYEEEKTENVIVSKNGEILFYDTKEYERYEEMVLFHISNSMIFDEILPEHESIVSYLCNQGYIIDGVESTDEQKRCGIKTIKERADKKFDIAYKINDNFSNYSKHIALMMIGAMQRLTTVPVNGEVFCCDYFDFTTDYTLMISGVPKNYVCNKEFVETLYYLDVELDLFSKFFLPDSDGIHPEAIAIAAMQLVKDCGNYENFSTKVFDHLYEKSNVEYGREYVRRAK